jgi:hypothetical protein
MKFKLKDVHANPFRDMDRYPIHAQKIAQLKKSIETTDFWDNIVARKAPNGKGIEIAYGHHRLTALREMYPGTKEFDFIVRDLEDTDMLKIMAHENLDDWGHDSGIERETVRAVVQAFAADRIALAKPSKDTRLDQMRFAPSFCFNNQQVAKRAAGSAAGQDRAHPYNADTINAFLGGTMSSRTIQYTLQALCLIERGHLTESQLKGMTSNQCRTIVEETERAIKQAALIKSEAERKSHLAPTPILKKQLVAEATQKAKAIVKTTAKAVSSTLAGGGSQREAKAAATDARMSIAPKAAAMPEINKAAVSVAAALHRLLAPEQSPGGKLAELIKFKKHLSPTSLFELNAALDVVIEHAKGYQSRLK